MKITIPIEARPQSRPRFGRGKVYEPKEITLYKEKIKAAAQEAMAGNSPLQGALSCTIKFWKKFSATSRRYGDADNLAKAVMDALNKIVWLDDAQLVKIGVEKYQRTEPAVEIEVIALPD